MFLGIDAGSSSTKWDLIDESGNSVSMGSSGPMDGHIYREDSRNRVEQFLSELVNDIGPNISGIYAGITGASDVQVENSGIASLFKNYFPKSEILVEIDVALGYRANFIQSKGVYLYAGTGSIAIYQDAIGSLHATGGWGYLLGDEGAGYWIGREGIRAIMLEFESGVHSSHLQSIMMGQIKEFSRSEIIKFAYGQPRDQIARLAKPLIALANEGEIKCREIVVSAAHHLAELALRTERLANLNSARIVFGGGIAQSGGLLISELERLLGREVFVSKDNLSNEAAHLALREFGATS